MEPTAEFKAARRKVIDNTFRWLESLAESYHADLSRSIRTRSFAQPPREHAARPVDVRAAAVAPGDRHAHLLVSASRKRGARLRWGE